VNFQAMAARLRGSGLAVYAVELPGHDLAGPVPGQPGRPARTTEGGHYFLRTRPAEAARAVLRALGKEN
jgi:hypothetical protein